MSTQKRSLKDEKVITSSKESRRACSLCEHKFPKSKSRCPACGHWNVQGETLGEVQDTILLSDVKESELSYIKTGAWDRCFGMKGIDDFGIPDTGVTLIGGEPGAGKSTLALQLSDKLAGSLLREVLYVATEQGAGEIRATAVRLHLKNTHLIRIFPLGCTADLATVIMQRNPCALVLDSIPGMTGESDLAGAVETCEALKTYAVSRHMPCITIDHFTKEDGFAGLMKLQHVVDATIKLTKISEDPVDPIRHMVSIKNRFGPQAEIYFEMTAGGLIEYILPDDDDE